MRGSWNSALVAASRQDESVWARLDRNYEKFREARRKHGLHRGGNLCCTACGRPDGDSEKGWRAYLLVDDEVAAYCPECARTQLDGPSQGRIA
jgi:hypothetical protein